MRSLTPGILINRFPGDPLYEFILKEGYLPITCPLTINQFNKDLPSQLNTHLSEHKDIDAWILTSPTVSRFIEPYIPQGTHLITTMASLDALKKRDKFNFTVSDDPSSEALVDLIRKIKPEGGNYLLLHGQRSRYEIENSLINTQIRIWTLITHTEIANDQLSSIPFAGAYIALSPLQAELFCQNAVGLFPIGWGKLVERTFIKKGLIDYKVCEPNLLALHTLLKFLYRKGHNDSQV